MASSANEGFWHNQVLVETGKPLVDKVAIFASPWPVVTSQYKEDVAWADQVLRDNPVLVEKIKNKQVVHVFRWLAVVRGCVLHLHDQRLSVKGERCLEVYEMILGSLICFVLL